MRLFRYILAGVLISAVVLLALVTSNFPALKAVATRYLVAATGYLVVFVNNPLVPEPDTLSPVVTLIGASTAALIVGDTYTELGATSTDNVDSNLPIKIYVDGSASSTSLWNTFINSTIAGTHSIRYTATDLSGNTGFATRVVVVSAAQNSGATTSGGGGSGGGGGASGAGPVTSGSVPATSACSKSKGDLNCDAKVNITDFSLLAYWYKRPLTAQAIASGIDLNHDGKVTLADFSILAYYWNR